MYHFALRYFAATLTGGIFDVYSFIIEDFTDFFFGAFAVLFLVQIRRLNQRGYFLSFVLLFYRLLSGTACFSQLVLFASFFRWKISSA